MKINISKEIRNNKSISGHLILHALTETCRNKDFIGFLQEHSDYDNDKEYICDIKLMIDNVELPLKSFCDMWGDQVSRMISEKAKDIMKTEFHDVSELLYDLGERVQHQVNERMDEWEKEFNKK